ncbi:MAG: hypothetical protein ACOC16_02050 [Nanoarchaeota archaeon]
MNLSNKNKIIVNILIAFFLITISFASYPQFEYTTPSSLTSQATIDMKTSSGTQIELYLNDILKAQQDVYAENIDIYLEGDDIEDITLPLGATLNIYNNHPTRIYNINISTGTQKILNNGDSISFQPEEISQIIYKDEEIGTQKRITVVDQLVDINFSTIQDDLISGENEIKIVQKYPFPTYESSNEYTHTLTFDKYSNSINISDYENVISETSVNISGSISDSDDNLYYILNKNPNNIGNLGLLSKIDLTGSLFEIIISGLRENENQIYFVTTNPSNDHLFTSLTNMSVTVDRLPPYVDILSVNYRSSMNNADVKLTNNLNDDLYVNGNSLIYNISTDANVLNYTFNNKNYTSTIEDNLTTIQLNLVEGQNNLTFIAVDLAGNINKQAHNIMFSNKPPALIDETLEPEEMFKNGVARFFSQEIEGKTNKGGVEMTIFTLPYDAQDSDGNNIRCDDYQDLFVRNLGQLDNERVDDPELNLEEKQISLTNYMFQKTTITSDSSGNFDARIGLQEKNFDQSDYNQANNENKNPEVSDVSSRNTICFIMQDKFGNVGIDSKQVELDAGNTMWKPGEITTIPNTLYASEIENVGDFRSGSGNVEFAMIGRFQYIGPGQISQLTRINIREDTKTSKHSQYAQLDQSRMNYRLDKDTGELIVHIPVKILPMKIKPLDYPDELKFAFRADLTYSVDESDIPIDTQNPIYFQTSVNIESPLDSTKWLTPEMIDDWIGYLNETITFTQQAVEWTGTASVVGVVACTASKFWYGIKVASIGDDEDAKNDAKRKMFMICDRVACTASPQECEGDFVGLDQNNNGVFVPENSEQKHFTQSELEGKAMVTHQEGDDELLAQFDTLSFKQPCDYSGNKEMDGVIVSGRVTKFEKEEGIFEYTSTSEGLIHEQCVPATIEENQDGTFDVSAVNLQAASGVCFSQGAPKFDETRCNFFGLDPQGVPGWDSSDNVIESIRCGCVTDTYSHLKNYLKIMESIKGCLEQAKIGETKGSYCERLMGQAICDIATNVIFKTLSQKSTRTGSDGSDPHENPFLQGISGLKEGDKVLNERYKGTFYSQAGLGSEQIVNKMCLVALTGDWSVLTDNILSSIDQNEVEPAFGPMFPESRIQGYNPLTGDLSMMYRFTHAAVSGGQDIRSSVEFICDPQSPGGEHCPSTYETSSNPQMGSSFSLKNLYVRAGGSVQDTVVVTDVSAKYRYNKVRIEHKYSLKGEQKTKVYEENIYHKGEFMLANCYFTGGVVGVGSGFDCDTLFDNDALLSNYELNQQNTKIIPQTTIYQGNTLFLNLGYDVRTDFANEQNSLDLAYIITCPATGENGQAIHKDVKPINVNPSSSSGLEILDLFKFPDTLGEEQQTQSTNYYFNTRGIDVDEILNNGNYDLKLKVINTAGTQGQTLRIKNAEFTDGAMGVSIGQSLTVNQEAENPSNLNSIKDDFIFETDKRYNIEFDGNVENVNIELIADKKDSTSIEKYPFTLGKFSDSVDEYNFNKLKAGSCTLEIKLLPSGKGNDAINSESLKDYSAIGDNIQTDNKIAAQDYMKLSFTLGQTPPTQSYSFEIVEPFESGSYCIESTKSELPISYIFQTSDNKELEMSKLTYKLSVEGYRHDDIGETIDGLARGKIENINEDASQIINLIKGEGTQNIKLLYDLTTQIGDNPETTKSNSISYKIRVPDPEKGESCVENSYYDYSEESGEEETGDEGGENGEDGKTGDD